MKIFILLDPPTVTAQMNKVAIVNNRPIFYKLENVVFSDTLQSIGKYAFSNTNIKYIEIPSTIQVLRAYTFYNARSLEKIVLHEGLEKIENSVFYNAVNLQSIELPQTLKRIGDFAFSDVRNLKSIRLSKEIVEIGYFAFYNTKDLVFFVESKEVYDTWENNWNPNGNEVIFLDESI